MELFPRYLLMKNGKVHLLLGSLLRCSRLRLRFPLLCKTSDYGRLRQSVGLLKHRWSRVIVRNPDVVRFGAARCESDMTRFRAMYRLICCQSTVRICALSFSEEEVL